MAKDSLTDTAGSKTVVDAKPQSAAHIKCDLHNPTRARRVIYDGIEGSMKEITVDPGATLRGVALHRAVAEELRDRNRVKKDSDLVIKPMSGEPEVPKVEQPEPTAH